MITKLKRIAIHLRAAVVGWWARDPFTQSAAVAYYTIFSFPALMILYFAAASIFMRKDELREQTYVFLVSKFGPDSAAQLEKIITNTAPEQTSIWAFVLAGCVLLYAAVKVFLQLQKALNYIWEVDDRNKEGYRYILIRRAVSFSVMLGVIFTLATSMLLTSLISVFTKWIMLHLPSYVAFVFHFINIGLSLATITLLFTILLKKLPDAFVRWRDAATGALLSAILFVLGEYALGLYFSVAKPSSAYGVTGSIILLMLWVSYSCVILLLGAELSKVLSRAKRAV